MPPGAFKKWDLTRDWPASSKPPLVLELDTHRLLGLALGDRFDSLQGLGRPNASFPVYDETHTQIAGADYVWLDLGLTVRVRNEDKVESWDLEVGGDNIPPVVHYKGSVVDLAALTTAGLRDLFGAATEEGVDSKTGESPTPFALYAFPPERVQWIFELDDHGHVGSIAMDPL